MTLISDLSKKERLTILREFQEFGACRTCAERETCEKIFLTYDSNDVQVCETVEERKKRQIRESIAFITGQYPEVLADGIVFQGVRYDLVTFEELMYRSPFDRHALNSDRCKKDLTCKACGDPICVKCCHWSPLLYTHPDDVYCTDCCPSCHFARDISRSKENQKELQRQINAGTLP